MATRTKAKEVEQEEVYSFNENFQENVVLLAIREDDWLARHRPYLKAEYLESPEQRLLMHTLLSFFDKYGVQPDFTTLENLLHDTVRGEQLSRTLQHAKSLARRTPSESVSYYVSERVVRFATVQHYRKNLLMAASALEAGNVEAVTEVLSSATSFATQVMDPGVGLFDPEHIELVAESDISEIDAKIPTLMPTLDKVLNGGTARKQLHAFLAPPHRGKSMGLINVGAYSLFAGANVLHVTCEMSEKQTALRYYSKLSGMTHEQIRRSPDLFKKRMLAFRSMYHGNLRIKEYPSRTATVADLEAYVKMVVRNGDFLPDILIVDYVGEMKRPKNDNQSYALGDVYSGLRALGTKFDIGVWTALQTNRAGFNKPKLDLDDIADSWEEAKISDVIIAMVQTEDEKLDGMMRWYVVKNRSNKPYYKPIFQRTRFEISSFKEVTDMDMQAA